MSPRPVPCTALCVGSFKCTSPRGTHVKSARCLKAVTSKRATSQAKAQQCVKIIDKKLKEPREERADA